MNGAYRLGGDAYGCPDARRPVNGYAVNGHVAKADGLAGGLVVVPRIYAQAQCLAFFELKYYCIALAGMLFISNMFTGLAKLSSFE